MSSLEIDNDCSEMDKHVTDELNNQISSSVKEVILDLTITKPTDAAKEVMDLTITNATDSDRVNANVRPIIRPRNYQREMLEASLARNVIIAIETGGGKTHIAVMRIQAELERMAHHQRVWFLATTVPLCTQQHDTITRYLPGVHTKLLLGSDDVQHWSTQAVWDAVLTNVRVVVSTYQILYDVLQHAFVQMADLALVVFDEAHNCIGKSAGKKLMTEHYHPRKARGLSVPSILGLTASPVMQSSLAALAEIESSLGAICTVPKRHRAELQGWVHCPVLERVWYRGAGLDVDVLPPATELMSQLRTVYAGLNIQQDPYVLSLKRDATEKNERKLRKVLENRKTYCSTQVKTLLLTAQTLVKELGPWCADSFISTVAKRLVDTVRSRTDPYLYMYGDYGVSEEELRYLAESLQVLDLERATRWSEDHLASILTDKVNALITAIAERQQDMSAIVFVKERAVVALLHALFQRHAATSSIKVGTMVGTSQATQRVRNIADILDPDAQKDTLRLFKENEIAMVIATDVLQEGIDVSACNVVFCFSQLPNLKSFIQRRGRARQKASRLVLLLDPDQDDSTDWEHLEAEMRGVYEDEMRQVQKLQLLEDEQDPEQRRFRVPSTGAMIHLDSAIPHLHHFCATLSLNRYVDPSPDFTTVESRDGFLKATVTLPMFLHESLRRHDARLAWKSEKQAMKDAAFEAYVELYKAGLVNEHLLPRRGRDVEMVELSTNKIAQQASLIAVREQWNPWAMIAKQWRNLSRTSPLFQIPVKIGELDVVLYFPLALPRIPEVNLYWRHGATLPVSFGQATVVDNVPGELEKANMETLGMFQAALQHRRSFAPGQFVMPMRVHHAVANRKVAHPQCLVRDRNGVPFIYHDTLARKPPADEVQKVFANYDDAPTECAYYSLQAWPKNLDFYHQPVVQHPPSRKPHEYVLPVEWCTLDEHAPSWQQARLALLAGSLMRHIEVSLLAEKLSKSILKEVAFTDPDLVVTCLSASSARESTNYQRLEFVGDSILKLCASVLVMDQYPLWPEGYLSFKKDTLVANARLCQAAMETGLDEFILTRPFTGKKHSYFVDDLIDDRADDATRELSSKIPADVVESLIGAAMIDGGFVKALACISIFLPELDWHDLAIRRASLYEKAPVLPLSVVLQPVEDLLGYTFTKPGLLQEAVTHASCNTGSASYERLEFLGDALLDHIVVTTMRSESRKDLTHAQLHTLRTALVNADFLAFVSMETSTRQQVGEVVSQRRNKRSRRDMDRSETPRSQIETVESTVSLPLWCFMRQHSPRLTTDQHKTVARHAELASQLRQALQCGPRYPWADLARLKAEKFFSDMIESILGAVWIDSGSLETCRALLERLGVLPCLRRLLRDNVEILHPKESVGQLADTETVTYIVSWDESESDVSPSANARPAVAKLLACRLLVGEEEIVCVRGGWSKLEVETRAAERAADVLRERRRMKDIEGH